MPVTDQAVLDYIAAHPGAGREGIRNRVAPRASGPTMWRALKRLTDEGKLTVTGKARSTGYTIAGSAVVRAYLQLDETSEDTKARFPQLEAMRAQFSGQNFSDT